MIHLRMIITLSIIAFGVSTLFIPSDSFFRSDSELPSSFDLRKYDRVSSARRQAWGTCWIFAAFSSIESDLMTTGHWKETGESGEANLSEYYLDKYNPFTRKGHNDHVQEGWYSGQGENFIGGNTDAPSTGVVVHLGGDFKMVAASFNNGLGAVQERLTPNIPWQGSHELFGDTQDEGILYEHPDYLFFYPHHIEWLTLQGSEAEKHERIKRSIMEYGAVASAEIMGREVLGHTKDGYEIHGVFPGGQRLEKGIDLDELEPPNHAVSIIGWNDDLRWRNHRGAWLIKDSDHKDYNDEHINYFYILYDDLIMGKAPEMGGVRFRSVVAEELKVYNHALHGWRYSTQKDPRVQQVMIQYHIEDFGLLDSLGIYTLKLETFAELEIYRIRNQEKIKIWEGHRTYEYPGLHRLVIDESIKLAPGDKVQIVYTTDKGGYAYDASFELDVLLGNSLPEWGEPVHIHSSAQKGETFYRAEQNKDWIDFYDYIHPQNDQSRHPHARENPTASLALSLFMKTEEK